MKCRIVTTAAVVCAFALVAESAVAQAPARPRNFGRPSTPPISPNLLLLNQNNSFDYNYLATMGVNRRLNQVRQQYGRELDAIERDFYSSRTPVATPRSSIAPMTESTTGHPTGFFNYGGYYRVGPR